MTELPLQDGKSVLLSSPEQLLNSPIQADWRTLLMLRVGALCLEQVLVGGAGPLGPHRRTEGK